MKHEDKKSSDRPSMRRLSSLSSLASLTLFSRRRSGNIPDSSSGSNLATNSQADSSPATGSNRDESAKPNKSFAARTLEKSTSWVLLPAPKSKLSVPRTRTMSQLPVAVKGRKPIDELAEQIPSEEVPRIARSNGLKTPLRSRLPSLAKNIVKSNVSRSFVKPVGPLVTSETEPLLGFPQLHRNRASVAVDTKENDRPGRRTGLQTNGPTFVQPSRYSGQEFGPLHSNPNRPPMYKSRIAEPGTQASPAFGTPQPRYSPVGQAVDQPRQIGSRSITHLRGKSLNEAAPMLKHSRSRTLTTSLLPLRHQATVERLENGQETESIEGSPDPTHVSAYEARADTTADLSRYFKIIL